LKLAIATRRSPLARWQAEHVAALLGRVDPELEFDYLVVDTFADQRADVPIWTMGGKGVFVKEVEAAVLDGRADLAVHSAKDLTSTLPDGLVIGAVPERGDPRDGLVGCALAELPVGARVATGSVRRRSQLADLRPDLTFAELRGNMHTRLEKAREFDAIMVGVVALDRLGLGDRVSEALPPWLVIPQVGQGALAVQCRPERAVLEMLAAVEHETSRRAVDAERAFLAELGGDCHLAAGAYAIVGATGEIELAAVLASLDGHVVLRHRISGTDPIEVGSDAARHLLDAAGGRTLLAAAVG
jgi:hydroxymethylbilane synthase